jgi:hypothetical protein
MVAVHISTLAVDDNIEVVALIAPVVGSPVRNGLQYSRTVVRVTCAPSLDSRKAAMRGEPMAFCMPIRT